MSEVPLAYQPTITFGAAFGSARFSQRPFVRCLFADPNIHFALLRQTYFQAPPLDCNDMEELMRFFWFRNPMDDIISDTSQIEVWNSLLHSRDS